MWNGIFVPNLRKRAVEAVWIPEPHFDVEDDASKEELYEDGLDQRTSRFVVDYAEDFEGTMFVRLGEKVYAFPCTAGEFVAFKKAGFDLAYLNSHFTIQYVGDWGWPWGRERR